MRRERVVFYLKLLLAAYFLFLLGWGLLWTYDNILKLAYVSTVDSCGIKNASDIGYSTQGSYSLKNDSIQINIPSNFDIESYKKTEKYQRFLKHELCHQDQANDSRLNGCGLNKFGFPGARMMDEAECYFRSYF